MVEYQQKYSETTRGACFSANIMDDVIFLLPAFNEKRSIGNLLDNIQNLFPTSEIIVIDNNSDDGTGSIAKKKGITVIHEKKTGKRKCC